MSTAQQPACNDLAEVMHETYTPPSGFKPVKLTPQQESEWDVTRALFLNTTPALAHVFYTMMSYSDGRTASFTDDPRLPIAATDGQRLLLRPATFFKLPLRQRVFVLAHEVMHAILDHCAQGYRLSKRGSIAYPDGKRLPYDGKTMNIALDYVINALLIQSAIGDFVPGACWDPTGKIATADDDALDVYRRLYEDDQGGKGRPCPDGSPGPGKSFDELLAPGELGDDDGKAGPGGADGPKAEAAMQGRSELEWSTAVSAGISAARAQGKLPGALDRFLGNIVDPQVRWQDHIQALFARKLGAGGYDWRRPDRQMIARPFLRGITSGSNALEAFDAVFAPGRSGKGVGCVIVAIDTSASIKDPELDVFFTEMAGLLDEVRPQRLIVMWCDAKVHRIDEVEDSSDLVSLRKKGAPGGGGTSFIPVFDTVKGLGLNPDALVYLTDGDGSFPQAAPAYPVIWGSILNTAEKYPFGDVVMIKL